MRALTSYLSRRPRPIIYQVCDMPTSKLINIYRQQTAATRWDRQCIPRVSARPPWCPRRPLPWQLRAGERGCDAASQTDEWTTCHTCHSDVASRRRAAFGVSAPTTCAGIACRKCRSRSARRGRGWRRSDVAAPTRPRNIVSTWCTCEDARQCELTCASVSCRAAQTLDRKCCMRTDARSCVGSYAPIHSHTPHSTPVNHSHARPTRTEAGRRSTWSVAGGSVINKLTRIASAWWGFASADDRNCLEAFLRKSVKLAYRGKRLTTFVSICDDTDRKLFARIIGNTQ